MKSDLCALANGLEVAEAFQLDTDAVALIDFFLCDYRGALAALAPFGEAARGQNGESWATRRIAIVLLENIVWRRLPCELTALPALLGEQPPNADEFVRGLQQRIGRLSRIHWPLLSPEPTVNAWADCLHVARQECKSTLARWLLTTSDVVREISSRVAVTEGVSDRAPAIVPIHRWNSQPTHQLPEQEADLVAELRARNPIYWVTPRVGSEINALVEYPLNSAALVIKPPGSDLEIQIKRSGLRGRKPLDVIFSRNGKELPSSHRVHGGSFGWLAKREARASQLFAEIYAAIHGEPCPCNRTVAISSVVEVPSERGPIHILDYLTEGGSFGEGFEPMRRSMRQTAASLPLDTGVKMPKYEGPLGETLRFIAQAVPQQAIQIHTTSYRLERVAGWLSEAGMRRYFEGAGLATSPDEARRFACDVLDEVLGGVTPAGDCAESYSEFLDACFALPDNRERADRIYLSLMEQTGKTWGTLLGVRGYTDGESFVIRNSGIRSIYMDGEWEPRMRFMDHDDMIVIGRDRRQFWPGRGLLGMSWDERHILGGNLDGAQAKGIAGALREIYRVSDEAAATGRRRLRESAKAAYRKTQTALQELPDLRRHFPESFVAGIRDLDTIVSWFFDSSDIPEWRADTRKYLDRRGYSRELVDNYLWAVENRQDFLRRMAFLFAP